MQLFENYLQGLDDVLSKKIDVNSKFLAEQRTFSKGFESKELSSFTGVQNVIQIGLEGPKVLFEYNKAVLEQHFGVNHDAFEKITIGAHPDFKELEQNNYINHHCVSVFVDIKGSTRLIEKYSLLEVRLIKDSLLTLAIQIASQFGGHVHRLQGDGIFLQFVRKDKHPNNAIINALNATSILTQFVTVDLAKMLSKYDLRPIKIRTGIDYGSNDQVLWSHYGLPGCSELTTTSLHTDMAAKLQGKAYDNSILIGGNVKTALDLKSDFYSTYENLETREKVYQISRQFTYPFYVFNWQEYLLTLPFIWKTSDGRTLELRTNSVWIDCYVSNEDGTEKKKYYPNSTSIPKNKKITFTIMRGNTPYVRQTYEKIEWQAHNSGSQAAEENQLNHDFGKKYNNSNYCETGSAFLGHHYVECRIVREHSNNDKISFPIFVQ